MITATSPNLAVQYVYLELSSSSSSSSANLKFLSFFLLAAIEKAGYVWLIVTLQGELPSPVDKPR